MTDLTLYLLRHGESVANVGRVFAARKVDPSLSDVGVRQAKMQAESLNDVGNRFKSFLNGLEGEQQKPILIVGHCLLFMAVIWLFCENHGSMFEDGHMGRGHLSVISGSGDRFSILRLNIPPDASA